MVEFALLRYLSEFRLTTESFVVLIMGNSKSNHLGVQGTFKRAGSGSKQNAFTRGGALGQD